MMAINVIAPTTLNAKLKSLMESTGPPLGSAHPAGQPWLKFIVNVSAMEVRFYRFKKETHPHTNMAKAALNMQVKCTLPILTLTLALTLTLTLTPTLTLTLILILIFIYPNPNLLSFQCRFVPLRKIMSSRTST